jgi:hypothetical protein
MNPLRYGNYFVWIVLIFITIITFIVGSLFGIVGKFTNDLVPVLTFIFSDNNLLGNRYVINHKQAAEIIDVCLNYGGDISAHLYDIQNTEMHWLDIFYLSSVILNNAKINNYFAPTDLTSYIQTKNLLQTFIDDFTLIQNGLNITNSNNINNILIEMRKWSDASYINTYQNNCSNITKDQWVQFMQKCDSGYTYNSQDVNKQDCLNFESFNIDWVNSRYNLNCSLNSDVYFTSVNQANKAYYRNILNLINQNQNLLNEMLSDLSKYYKLLILA